MVKKVKDLTKASILRDLNAAHAKTLYKMGKSIPQISELLGLSVATIHEYLKISNETIRELEEVARKIYLAQEFNLAKLAYDELIARLKDDNTRKKIKFFDLVGLYKIARGVGQVASTNATQVNVNVISDDKTKTFRLEVDKPITP
ncbi:MAG: hypothetical protein QXY47_05435 [Thermoplasmata archaeon]